MTVEDLIESKKVFFRKKDFFCLGGTYYNLRGIPSNVELFNINGHIIERYIPKLNDYVIGIVSDSYGITNSSAICRVIDVQPFGYDDITVKVIKSPYDGYISREFDVKSIFFRKLTDEELIQLNEEVNRNEVEGVTGS